MTPRPRVTEPYAFRRSRYKPRERTRRTALAEVGKPPARAETTIGLVSLASCFRCPYAKIGRAKPRGTAWSYLFMLAFCSLGLAWPGTEELRYISDGA
jgi:hypothetical protein